jgi:hypothetical protein
MLKSLLSWGEWSDLAELLSPRFFKVVSVTQAITQLREFKANYDDREGFEDVCRRREWSLQQAEIPVDVNAQGQPEGSGPIDGQVLLRLYFHQLYSEGPTVVDLRPQVFDGGGDRIAWYPGRFYVDWDEEFLASLRQMYDGFYSDDEEAFERGVEDVGLEGCSDLFRQHFGGDDQRAVSFELASFRETFRKIFRRAKERGLRLHPNFIALGVYLATLYQHLEEAGGTFDVRQAFESVRQV